MRLLSSLAKVQAALLLVLVSDATSAERPFRANSLWNREISREAMGRELAELGSIPVGLSSWLGRRGSSIPIYRSEGALQVQLLYHPDAWRALHSGRWRHQGNGTEVEAEIRRGASPVFPLPYHPYVSQSATELKLPPHYSAITNPNDGSARRIYSPAKVLPVLNSDGHLVIEQPDGRMLESYASIILGDGTIVCLSYQLTDPRGHGSGFDNGVTAAMIPVYAGLIRRGELERGSIDHALKLVVPASLLHPSFVAPAVSFDRGALRETPPYSGTLPMGARLALPRSLSLSALGLESRDGRTIAEAARRYGMIITDRGGGGITIVVERGAAPPGADRAAVERDLRRIVSRLVVLAPDQGRSTRARLTVR